MAVDSTGLEYLTALAAVVTLPAGILAFVLFGVGAAAAVFVVGWLLVVPVAALAAGYFQDREPDEPDAPTEDPLEALRRRYAEGEIDEAEFERRVDRLIETEDLEVEVGDLEVEDPVEADPDPVRDRE